MMSESARRLAGDPANVEFARMLAARAAARHRFDRDELEASALLGLCLAASRFDPAHGHAFLAFAAPRIWGAMADFARAWRTGKRHHPGARQVSLDELLGGAMPIGEALQSDDLPVGELEESRDAFEGLIRDLPASRKVALRLLYLDCSVAHVQSRAAARLGIGRTRVQQLHAESIDSLRSRMAAP